MSVVSEVFADAPEAQLLQSLSALRALNFVGPAVGSQHLVPGIFFSIDPEARDSVEVACGQGALLSIRLAVEGKGRWLSLNLGLGPVDLSQRQVIGFACKTDANGPVSFRVSVRSGIEGGFRDAFFPKTVRADTETSVHLDVMEMQDHPNIPVVAPWRELVVFFERQNAEIVLRDFRLIII